MGTKQVRFWNVPYRRNPYFTGREDLLTRLHELLRSSKAAALTQPQAISGLGGIGKTQTAMEYAYRSRADYQAVLWASAATREALISDFVALAALLQLPERDLADQGVVVAAVKRWLASNKGWLLILDNADDLEMAAEFMPLASSGHILLTTRAQFTGTIANSLEVEKMEQPEGALLLLRRAKKLAADAPLEQATAPDRSLAEAVVKELDGLPLALDQAGAYIEETNCGLSALAAKTSCSGAASCARSIPNPLPPPGRFPFKRWNRPTPLLLSCCVCAPFWTLKPSPKTSSRRGLLKPVPCCNR